MATNLYSPDQLSALGNAIFEQQVRPTLAPADNGKFIAIDVVSGDHELDVDDYAAVMRLRSRRPAAEILLLRAGAPTTCRIGAVR